jgi:hypothetical protein
LGLAPAAWGRLFTETDEIVNAPANTSFAEKHRAEIERADLEGLRNVLAFVRCPPFTYERFRVCMDYAVKPGWGRTLGLG